MIIDWKRRAMKLVQAIQEDDLDRALRMAAGLRRLEDLQDQTHIAYITYVNSDDKKKTEGLFNDYLALVRLTNETAEMVDQEVEHGT